MRGACVALPAEGATHPNLDSAEPLPPISTAGGASSADVPACLPGICLTAVQQLGSRFQFLWGIYQVRSSYSWEHHPLSSHHLALSPCIPHARHQAHSNSEDEIVFPALESKQALRNVSRTNHPALSPRPSSPRSLISHQRHCPGEPRLHAGPRTRRAAVRRPQPGGCDAVNRLTATS